MLSKTLRTSTRSHVNNVKNLNTTIARLSCISRLANGFTRTRHDNQLPGFKQSGYECPTGLNAFHDL